VYDAVRQRVVMFGGGSWTELPLDDTWEWDGVTWAQQAPTTRPPARFWHGLAYDAARQRTVLFGGSGLVGGLDDTWEWDGVAWQRSTPRTSPPPSPMPMMVYDRARRRVVLGGERLFAPSDAVSTWEWDGTDWRRVAHAGHPGARRSPAMATVTHRDSLVLCGAALDLCHQPGLALGDASPILSHLSPLGIAIPNQNDQLPSREGHPCVQGLRPPRKASLRESLHHEPVALAVIEQELQRGRRAVSEDVDGPLQGVVAEALSTDGGQPIDAFSEIDRFSG
jgi:hypothetical protein